MTVIVLLAVRHLARRKLFVAVAALGLVLGVASMTATELLYGSVVGSHEETMTRLAGRAALQVSNGESGVPEELADEIRGAPGVRAVAASAAGFVATPDFPGERLYLYGVDLLADQEVRDYGAGAKAVVSDPMVFLAAPDSVAVTAAFARTHGLALNDRLRVLAPAGIVTLTIRAVLDEQKGPASALDGRLAIVDLSVAQDVLRLGRRVSELAVTVDAGADLGAVEHALAAAVGSRGVIERPRGRTAAFARLLANYRNGFFVAAVLAGIVALYLLANLAAIAVAERRREIALMRSLGMSATGVIGLVLVELSMVATLATACGIPLGVALARALLASFAQGAGTLYGDAGSANLHLDRGPMAFVAVLGMTMPLLATLGAVRRIARVQPLEALRTPIARGGRPCQRGSTLLGAGLTVLALVTWLGRSRLPVTTDVAGMTTMLGGIVGLAAMVPAAVYWLIEIGARIVDVFGWPVLPLALRSVRSELRNIAITCTAVWVSVAGTIAVATWISSLDATVQAAFDTVFANVDLVVSGGADPFAAEAVRMPASVADEIAAFPDVAAADAVRIDTIAYAGGRAAVVAADVRAYVDGRRRLFMVEGDPATAAASLVAGTGVVVNQAFARRFERRPGDVLDLMTPEGALRARIEGIYLELTPGDLGTIRLDRGLYRRWWRDDTVTLVEVSLRTTARAATVASAIRARFGDAHRVVVFTIAELRRTYRDLLGRMTRLVDPLLFVAVGCGLIGVASAGAAALMARRRTTAVLRAVGVTATQLAQVLACELGVVGASAVALASIVGAALGWMQVEVLLRGMLGMAVLYSYPRSVALWGGGAIVTLTAAVGWLLGRRAARVSLGSALHCE